MKKKRIMAAGMLALMVCMTGCGSSKSDMALNEYAAYDSSDYGVYTDYAGDSMDYDYSAEMSQENIGTTTGQADSVGESAQTTQRKLIRTVNLDVETEDFEGVLSQVEQKVSELGGYVEDSRMNQGSVYSKYSNRNADYTIRIPEQRLNEFVQVVEEGTNVTYKQNSVEDITLSYVDLNSHKEALETEQTRLLELLEQAEDMSDILAIENELSNVRYQIESMESQLRTYDNQVDYATVYLYINEVERLTEIPDESVWSRITTGFANSIYNIGIGLREAGIWILINLPYLILWGIVILIIVLIIRKIRKKRRMKKQKKMEDLAAQQTPSDK